MNLYYDSADQLLKAKLIEHLKNIFNEVIKYYDCRTAPYRWTRSLAYQIILNGRHRGAKKEIPFLKSNWKKERDPAEIVNIDVELLKSEIGHIETLCSPQLKYYITVLKQHLGLTGDE